MHILSLIITILITISCYPQDQAVEIMDRLNEQIEKYKNISIEFELILENKQNNISETKVGKIVLEEEKYWLDLGEQLILCDGINQWIYLKDLNEVQIMEYDPANDKMSPRQLLTNFKSGYKYQYVHEIIQNKKPSHIIELYPEKSTEFIKIELCIEKEENILHQSRIFDKNGGIYTYKVTSFIANSMTPEFSFDTSKHTNIEIIDLR